MYRKRLRSPAGCMRCKNRHSKCDEQRPRCSFCTRHHLECIWPTSCQPRRKAESQLAVTSSCKTSMVARGPAANSNMPTFDPFHTLPLLDCEDIGVVMDSLHGYFLGITQSVFPFDDVANTHRELTHGWLKMVYSDEVVCSSFVTYCAWFYSKRAARQCDPTAIGLKSEARSLALLRGRVTTSGTVTEGTLLAAAIHLFIATFSTEDAAQISRIAQGIYALIAARGGPCSIMHDVNVSTMRSLVLADDFNSLLNAQKPFLTSMGLPPRPCSYDSIFKSSTIDGMIASCLEQGVMDVLKDIQFALFFRKPSQQTRRLSQEESRYLFLLLPKISHTLCIQQSQFISSNSVSEIAIYGMILVKEEVFPEVVEHPIMPITILRRLRSAISTQSPVLRGPGLTVALWASTVALVLTEFEAERTWALKFIMTELVHRYGRIWPQDWTIRLRRELQQLLWHHRIETAFTRMCAKVCHLRSECVDHTVE